MKSTQSLATVLLVASLCACGVALQLQCGQEAECSATLPAAIGSAPGTPLVAEPPQHGTAIIRSDQVIYEPSLGWAGSDSFQLTSEDASVVEDVSVEVNPSTASPTLSCPTMVDPPSPDASGSCFTASISGLPSATFQSVEVLASPYRTNATLASGGRAFVCAAPSTPPLPAPGGVIRLQATIVGSGSVIECKVRVRQQEAAGLRQDPQLLASLPDTWVVSGMLPSQRMLASTPSCETCTSVTFSVFTPPSHPMGARVLSDKILEVYPRAANVCQVASQPLWVTARLGSRVSTQRLTLSTLPMLPSEVAASKLLRGVLAVDSQHVSRNTFAPRAGFEHTVTSILEKDGHAFVAAAESGPGRLAVIGNGGLHPDALEREPASGGMATAVFNLFSWLTEVGPHLSVGSHAMVGGKLPILDISGAFQVDGGFVRDADNLLMRPFIHDSFGVKVTSHDHITDQVTGIPYTSFTPARWGLVTIRSDRMSEHQRAALQGFMQAGGAVLIRGVASWTPAATQLASDAGISRSLAWVRHNEVPIPPPSLVTARACSDNGSAWYADLSSPLLDPSPLKLHSSRRHIMAFSPPERKVVGLLTMSRALGTVPSGTFFITRPPRHGSIELNATTGQYAYSPAFGADGHALPSAFSWSFMHAQRSYEPATVWFTGQHPILDNSRRIWTQVPYIPLQSTPRTPSPPTGDAQIARVLFGQTHVQETSAPLLRLVGNRTMLVVVDVTSATGTAPPDVLVSVACPGQAWGPVAARPPATLPVSVNPYEHDENTTYMVTVPGHMVQPGIEVTVQLGTDGSSVTQVHNATVLGGWNARYLHAHAKLWGGSFGRQIELESGHEYLDKTPAASADFVQFDDWEWDFTVFPEGKWLECGTSPTPVLNATVACNFGTGGYSTFGTVLSMIGQVRHATGLHYAGQTWIGTVPPIGGGLGGGRSASGDVSYGVYFHELGHGWGLPHSDSDPNWPWDEICGTGCVGNASGWHGGRQHFISPMSDAAQLEYKTDPMWGGGRYAGPNEFFSMHADWNNFRIQNSMISTGTKLIDGKWCEWDADASSWVQSSRHVGRNLAVATNVSSMIFVGFLSSSDLATYVHGQPVAVSTSVKAGWDPTNPHPDAPSGDYTLRVSWELEDGSLLVEHRLIEKSRSDATEKFAIAMEAHGVAAKAELLLSPSAMSLGLPTRPRVLHSWTNPAALTQCGVLGDNPSFAEVTSSMWFPSSLADGAEVSWASSHPAVISVLSGRVSRPRAGEPNQAVTLSAQLRWPNGRLRTYSINAVVHALPPVDRQQRAERVALSLVQALALKVHKWGSADAASAFAPLPRHAAWTSTWCANDSALHFSVDQSSVRPKAALDGPVPVAFTVRVVHRVHGTVGEASGTTVVPALPDSVAKERAWLRNVSSIYIGGGHTPIYPHGAGGATILKSGNGRGFAAVGRYGAGAIVAFGREYWGSALEQDPAEHQGSRLIVQALELASAHRPLSQRLEAIRAVPGSTADILSSHNTRTLHPATGLSLRYETLTPSLVGNLSLNATSFVWAHRDLGSQDVADALSAYVFKGGVVLITYQVWNLGNPGYGYLDSLTTRAGFRMDPSYYYAGAFPGDEVEPPYVRKLHTVLSAAPVLRCPVGMDVNAMGRVQGGPCVATPLSKVIGGQGPTQGVFAPSAAQGGAVHEYADAATGKRLLQASDGIWEVQAANGDVLARQHSPQPRPCTSAANLGSIWSAPGAPLTSPRQLVRVIEIVQHDAAQPIHIGEIRLHGVMNGVSQRISNETFACFLAPVNGWYWFQGSRSTGDAPRLTDGDVATRDEVQRDDNGPARAVCVLDSPIALQNVSIDGVWWRQSKIEVRVGNTVAEQGAPGSALWWYGSAAGDLDAAVGFEASSTRQGQLHSSGKCWAWDAAWLKAPLSADMPWAVPTGSVAISCHWPTPKRFTNVTLLSSGPVQGDLQVAAGPWQASPSNRSAQSASVSWPFSGTGAVAALTWGVEDRRLVDAVWSTGVFGCGGSCVVDVPNMPSAIAVQRGMACPAGDALQRCKAALDSACRDIRGVDSAEAIQSSSLRPLSWNISTSFSCASKTSPGLVPEPGEADRLAAVHAACQQPPVSLGTVVASGSLNCAASSVPRPNTLVTCTASLATASAPPGLRVVAEGNGRSVSSSMLVEDTGTLRFNIIWPEPGVWSMKLRHSSSKAEESLGRVAVVEQPLRDPARAVCSPFADDTPLDAPGGRGVNVPWNPLPDELEVFFDRVACSGFSSRLAPLRPPRPVWTCDPTRNAAELLTGVSELLGQLSEVAAAPVGTGSLLTVARMLSNTTTLASQFLQSVASRTLQNSIQRGFPGRAWAQPILPNSYATSHCSSKAKLSGMWRRLVAKIAQQSKARGCAAGARRLSSSNATDCGTWATSVSGIMSAVVPAISDMALEVNDPQAQVMLSSYASVHADTGTFLQQYGADCVSGQGALAGGVQTNLVPCSEMCPASGSNADAACLAQCDEAGKAEAVAGLYCLVEPCPPKSAVLSPWSTCLPLSGCGAGTQHRTWTCEDPSGTVYPEEACLVHPEPSTLTQACVATTCAPTPSPTPSASSSVTPTPSTSSTATSTPTSSVSPTVSSTPTSTPTPSESASPSALTPSASGSPPPPSDLQGGGSSSRGSGNAGASDPGMIAGVSIAAVLVVAAVIAGVMLWRRKRNSATSPSQPKRLKDEIVNPTSFAMDTPIATSGRGRNTAELPA